MADNKPMSDEQLEAIKRHADHIVDCINEPKHISAMEIEAFIVQDVYRLLSEMERLRAEATTMRPIVAAVAEGASDSETGDCCFCGWSGYPHESNCPTAKARAFLASAGQAAESEGE